MKKLLSLLLIGTFLFSFVGCNDNTSNEQMSTNNVTENTGIKEIVESKEEFVVGEKLKCSYGDSFKMPHNSMPSQGIGEGEASITSITVTKHKVSDINNFEDYQKSGNSKYFYKYQYKVTIEGNVSENLSGNKINVNLCFLNDITILHNNDDDNDGGFFAVIKSDGSFDIEFIGFSNEIHNEFVPNSVFVQQTNL